MEPSFSILLVEDRIEDAELIRSELTNAGILFTATRIETKEQFTKEILKPYDLILADYSLPQFSAMEALELLKAQKIQTPCIIVTGSMDEETAVECMKSGAADYVLKGHMPRLPSAVRAALENNLAEEAKRHTEKTLARLAKAVDTIKLGVTITDTKGRIVYTNPAEAQMHGYEVHELIGKDARIFAPHALWDPPKPEYIRQMRNWRREGVNVRKDGSIFPVRLISEAVMSPTLEPIGMVTICEDLTDIKRSEDELQKSEQKYRHLFERNLAGVYRTTASGIILDCNESFAKILGYDSPAEILTHSMFEFYYHSGKRKAFLEELRKKNALKNVESTLKKKGGTPVWVLENVSLLHKDPDTNDEVLEGTLIDITDWKHAQQRLQYIANYDELTDLPSRLLFIDRLKQAMVDAEDNKRLVAVMLLDLDRFKTINETLGHEAGDSILRQAARRLATILRAGDTVARLGGDEFTFAIRNLEDVQDVGEAAKRILTVFEKPFQRATQELYVTGSMGIAIYPMDDANIDNLLKDAETAMYNAKGQGRNNFQFFKAEMNLALLKQLSLETSLRRAFERNEFMLNYQPKVNARTGEITGSEALVQWRHPELGILTPSQFIPLAEETGLIVPLGEWVLRAACKENAAWLAAGYQPLTVAVNLSVRQFKQIDLAHTIEQILLETSFPGENLELEITETILMRESDKPLEKLQALKKLGIKISIDDFGTGFSSLSYLKHFPIDKLKIDRSFVRDIPDDLNNTAITRAIILLAHNLKQRVVAEGVETAEQLAFLQAEDCDEVQGYYFARPLSPEAFLQKFIENKTIASKLENSLS